jgi:hypothetical protein
MSNLNLAQVTCPDFLHTLVQCVTALNSSLLHTRKTHTHTHMCACTRVHSHVFIAVAW